MARVSENSQTHALQFSLNKAKRKIEDLQLQGSTLKKLNRPSDNPVGNIEILSLKSTSADNKQYIRNIQYAQMNLNIVEQSITQLTDLMSRAKELSIQQSSDFYEANIRKGVANEVKQLRNHALSIANKRLGQKFIFGGYKSLEKPFDKHGTYMGDKGQVIVEVSKDFFVPINVSGDEIFYIARDSKDSEGHPLNRFPELNSSPNNNLEEGKKFNIDPVDQEALSRDLASEERSTRIEKRENIFSVLNTLHNALNNNDADVIQDLLPKIDTIMSRLVRLRARVGSISNSIESAKDNLDVENINMESRKSDIADADVAELFSDIQKHQGILQATYKSGQSAMNMSLLDFLR